MNTVMLEFDDNIYQLLIEQVGKDNLNQFFTKLVEPYLMLNKSDNIVLSDISPAEKKRIDERLANIENNGFTGRDYRDVLTDMREKLAKTAVSV